MLIPIMNLSHLWPGSFSPKKTISTHPTVYTQRPTEPLCCTFTVQSVSVRSRSEYEGEDTAECAPAGCLRCWYVTIPRHPLGPISLFFQVGLIKLTKPQRLVLKLYFKKINYFETFLFCVLVVEASFKMCFVPWYPAKGSLVHIGLVTVVSRPPVCTMVPGIQLKDLCLGLSSGPPVCTLVPS